MRFKFTGEFDCKLQLALFQGVPVKILRGQALPYGTNRTPHGVNFAVISRHSTDAWLVISSDCDRSDQLILRLDPQINRTGDVWHVRVEELPETFCYAWRMDGPKDHPHHYNPDNLLIDPFAKIFSCGHTWGHPCDQERLGLVTNYRIHRDESDRNPAVPRADTILYELHVRGFTVDPSAKVAHPGTFSGLIEKLDYIRDLGVTSLELLPVDEFDENDCPFLNPLTNKPLRNYWGYNTLGFFAPEQAYFATDTQDELRRAVYKLHKAHRVCKVCRLPPVLKVLRVCKAYKAYKPHRVHKAYKVHKAHKAYKVCKPHKVHKEFKVLSD